MSNICRYGIQNDSCLEKMNEMDYDAGYFKSILSNLNSFKIRDCFSDLLDFSNIITHTDFSIFINKNLLKERADWFLKQLQVWGFEFSQIKYSGGKYGKPYITVRVQNDNHRITLVTLIALRYLDKGEGLHHIINLMYEWNIKFPKINTFYLFQMAHFSLRKRNEYGLNSNHTFLDCWPVSRLSNLETFWKRAESEKTICKILGHEKNKLTNEEQDNFENLIDNENLDDILNCYA